MSTDLRLALRSLLGRPALHLLAIVTLALGIGATAAVFSLLDALYFRPLPLREPERLVRIARPSEKTVLGLLSYAECEELRGLPSFSELACVGGRGVTLRQRAESRLLIVKYVSPSFFETLGLRVARGRAFRPEDERAQAPLAVVNHQLWQERLDGRLDVVGMQLQLNDAHFTIVGVTEPGFAGLERTVRTDVWVLAQHARFAVPGLARELADRSSRWFEAYARLAPGATGAQAALQLEQLSERWQREDARAYAGSRLRSRALLDDYREGVRQGGVFLGLLGLVLLIASANAANLALARSEGRRRELAVRAAIGASRARLLRQLALESLLLCALGTLAGLALADAALQALPALLPPASEHAVLDVRFDARLLAFAALLLGGVTLLVAAAPAWRGSRPDVVGELKQAAPAGAARGRGVAVRDLIVVGQLAVSVMVLIGAGLLLRSLEYGRRLNPGFDPSKHVASFYLVPGLRGYDAAASGRFLEQARQGVAALPGVRRASFAIRLPAQRNEAGWAIDFRIPGRTPPPGEEAFRTRFGIVGPEYFEVLGARLLRGRGFRESDAAESAGVAVLNQTFAERLFPGEDPVGRRLLTGRSAPVEREIVGVVENGKIASLYEPPETYLLVPFAQQPQGFAQLLVESAAPPDAALFAAVRRRIAELDPELAILASSTLARHHGQLLGEERRDAWLAGAAALLALALGGVGVYGVASLLALRRTKELGIRIALGATRADVLLLVLGGGARRALLGCALGVAGGMALSRLLASRLHGVAATDPLAFAAGSACLLATALLASALPALRAARLDPLIAIREE
jgi:predicted permease